jgi:hypothetical protein
MSARLPCRLSCDGRHATTCRATHAHDQACDTRPRLVARHRTARKHAYTHAHPGEGRLLSPALGGSERHGMWTGRGLTGSGPWTLEAQASVEAWEPLARDEGLAWVTQDTGHARTHARTHARPGWKEVMALVTGLAQTGMEHTHTHTHWTWGRCSRKVMQQGGPQVRVVAAGRTAWHRSSFGLRHRLS